MPDEANNPPETPDPPDPPPLRLASPLADLPAVTKRQATLLRRLDLITVSDLLRHYPMRYEREAGETPIKDLARDGKTVGSARGTVGACQWVASQPYGRKGRFVATLKDPTGTLQLTWFNAAWLQGKLQVGDTLRVQGKVKLFNDYPQMANPKWEKLDEDDDSLPAAQARLRPVYPATDGLNSARIEAIVEAVLPEALPLVPDPLPAELVEHHNMPTLPEALRLIHRPDEPDDHKAARRRLAFNELLLLQLGIALKRAYVERRLVAPALYHSAALDAHIRQRFPFDLTPTQAAAVDEIAADLTRTRPMNRMLQGDVGSGKTVVALYALLMAVAERKQGALLAPTELLAEQHEASLRGMLEGSNVRIALLTGSRPEARPAVARGDVDLVVGTHALLSGSTRFHDLAVAVIDEQHRFGVMQRAALREPNEASEPGRPRPGAPNADPDKSPSPHMLVMTATPIPRTLSLTLLGDLDSTTLTDLPPGRVPIQNRVVGPETADEVYRYCRTRLERGEQIYVVVPAVEAGQTTGTEGEGVKLKSANEHAKLLQERFFHGYTVGVVHGQLKGETRRRVMDRFRGGKVHVLVATTVIEVGVDVPNANVMVIEHAERFGLAQLHQLRGRVGRGSHGRRPLCVFIAEPTTDDALARMEAIGSTNDGFKLAEADLQIRGMGEILGTRQSGAPPMRLAALPDDLDLLQLAKRDALDLIAADPDLAREEHTLLRRVLLSQYGEALGLVDVA